MGHLSFCFCSALQSYVPDRVKIRLTAFRLSAHTHIHAHTHTRTHVHTHTNRFTHTHMYTHTFTHAHTHTLEKFQPSVLPFKIDRKQQGYNHKNTAKDEHKEKISRSPTKWSFLQHTAVTVGENHVEQEVETDWPKIEKVGYQAPYLHRKYTITTNNHFSFKMLV